MLKMKKVLQASVVAVAMLLGSFSDALADYEAGKKAFDASDFETAMKEWKPLAAQGHARAQHGVGFMYATGRGVAQEYKEAVKWYRKAAEQGLAMAQKTLGDFYYSGQVVTQDYKEAVKWFRKAAEQGYAKAQQGVGFMYANGQGVAQEYKEAVKWYRKAAEQGLAFSQFNLGAAYNGGFGVAKDHEKAVEWYSKAAEQGHADAKSNLELLLKGPTNRAKFFDTGYFYLYGEEITVLDVAAEVPSDMKDKKAIFVGYIGSSYSELQRNDYYTYQFRVKVHEGDVYGSGSTKRIVDGDTYIEMMVAGDLDDENWREKRKRHFKLLKNVRPNKAIIRASGYFRNYSGGELYFETKDIEVLDFQPKL
jgi:TPR repeat protein